MPPFFFYFPRFAGGKQKAIRANYFAAKKSASREKNRNWKTGFKIEMICPLGPITWSVFSPVCRAEISARLTTKIVVNCSERLHDKNFSLKLYSLG